MFKNYQLLSIFRIKVPHFSKDPDDVSLDKDGISSRTALYPNYGGGNWLPWSAASTSKDKKRAGNEII